MFPARTFHVSDSTTFHSFPYFKVCRLRFIIHYSPLPEPLLSRLYSLLSSPPFPSRLAIFPSLSLSLTCFSSHYSWYLLLSLLLHTPSFSLPPSLTYSAVTLFFEIIRFFSVFFFLPFSALILMYLPLSSHFFLFSFFIHFLPHLSFLPLSWLPPFPLSYVSFLFMFSLFPSFLSPILPFLVVLYFLLFPHTFLFSSSPFLSPV